MVNEPDKTQAEEAPREPVAAEGVDAEPTEAPEGQPETPTDEEAETAELPAESDLEARLRQVSAAYVQLQDEMQAFRERQERIQQERDRRRQGEVVMAMFEPVQNLRRSVEAWQQLDLPEDATRGIGLVLEQFQGALSKLGLEEINQAPVPFDPNVHDAICTMPVKHAALDGQVIQVFEAGYRVSSMVIQAARVIIGRYEAPVPEQVETEPEGSEGSEE